MCPANKKTIPRCPYCVSENQFRPMKTLENERQICESCGHITFSNDCAFSCPCQNCLEQNVVLQSPKKVVSKDPQGSCSFSLRSFFES